MPAPSPSAQSTAPARHSWRNGLLWTFFAITLFTGLVLAVLYGGTAPTLLEMVGS